MSIFPGKLELQKLYGTVVLSLCLSCIIFHLPTKVLMGIMPAVDASSFGGAVDTVTFTYGSGNAVVLFVMIIQKNGL